MTRAALWSLTCAVSVATCSLAGAQEALTVINMSGLDLRDWPLQLSGRWLPVTVPAGGRVVLDTSPAPGVPATARWDAEGSCGELSNGLVTVRAERSGLTLLDASGRPLLQSITFYGWLTETPEPVVSPAAASAAGVPFLCTGDPAAFRGEVTSAGPAMAGLTTTRTARAAGISFVEEAQLPAGWPGFQYALTVRNDRAHAVYLANCDGVLFGRWGDALAAPRRLTHCAGRRGTVLGDWQAFGPAEIREGPAWAAASTDAGPGVGLSQIAQGGASNSWAFTRDNFWVYLTDPAGQRPIRLDPGGECTWHLRFVYSPSAGLAAADDIQRLSVLTARPPLTVLQGDHVLAHGATSALEEDFRAAERWLVGSGSLRPGPRGATLAADTPGAPARIRCALSMPLSAETSLSVDLAQLSPGATLAIAALAPDGRVLPLGQLTAAGPHVLRWPDDPAWQGRRDFSLQLSLGPPGTTTTLTSLRLAAGAPAPRLRSPVANQVVSTVAADFAWQGLPGAAGYEVQLAHDDTFTDPRTVRAAGRDPDPSLWVPEAALTPGHWFWRVRAVGDDDLPGHWSEGRAFTVQRPAAPQPSPHAPSPAHPLFILHAPDNVVNAWRIVPDDLRPYCALRIEASERGLDLLRLCRGARDAGVPLIIQCCGPNGNWRRQPLAELEQAFAECPNVIGALICEQNFHIRADTMSAEYARRLADLCTSRGRLLIFADGHWGSFAWLEMGRDPGLLSIFADHPRSVVPLWKMNCSQVPLTIHGSVMGYWLAGISAQYGIEPEDWYWFEAGYGDLGEGTGHINTGTRDKFPPSFWGPMILTGLASGATCWCLEPCWANWELGNPEQPTPTWTRVNMPLLRAIVRQRLVPDRATILDRTRIAVQTGPEDLAFSTDFGRFRTLYDTLYGLRHPAEVVPDRARYGFVPLLPPLAVGRPLPAGVRAVPLSALQTPEAVHQTFDPLYPPGARGDAFATRVGETLIAMNSHENEDVDQSFALPLGVPRLWELAGTLGPHAFMVGKVGDDSLWLQVNGRAERATHLTLHAPAAPQVAVTPADAPLTMTWDAASRNLNLTVAHSAGAVELQITAP